VVAVLEAGTVWVDGFSICDLQAHFGDIGDSGVGRRILQPWVLHRAQSRCDGGVI